MIQCTKCNLQYIGETKRRLKDRFNEHPGEVLDISLGGEVRRGLSYPDPV